MTLGYNDIIRARRKDMHLSQQAVAERACVGRQTVCNIEAGRSCTLDAFLSVVDALNMKLDFVERERIWKN